MPFYIFRFKRAISGEIFVTEKLFLVFDMQHIKIQKYYVHDNICLQVSMFINNPNFKLQVIKKRVNHF